MNTNKISIYFFLIFLLGFNCHAYDVGTHALLTEAVYENSVLSNTSRNLLLEIGMIKAANDPKREFPNEIIMVRNSTGTIERVNELMEPKQLLMFGAKHEDDLSLSLRVLNHFYDPQHRGTPLTVFGFFRLGQPSPDWALEDRSTLSIQFYSYKDALEYFHKSLTEETLVNRNKNAGRFFQSLGQIVHHVQDMAQPQHTRNDPHSPFNSSASKYYESYTQRKAGNLPLSGYGTVDISIFSTPRTFWDNGDGKGLAEFSSNNFVSAGTNFKGSSNNVMSNTHPNPAGSSATTEDWDITHPELLGPVGPGQPLQGDITFVATDVTDSYRVETSMPNPRTSSYSLFDYDLKQYNFDKSFTLNRFNFDTAYSFLLPRAVSYSAGLIDYFFRGRFELIEQQSDEQNLIVRIKNISGGQNGMGNSLYDLNEGDFQVLYETSSGERYPLTISSTQLSGTSLAGTLASGNEIEITVELPPEDAELADKKPFIVVYRGNVGPYEAVIGLALPRQTGHGFVLNIPGGPNAGDALLTQKSGQWAVEPIVNPAFGSVDWKGQYVNGVATKVLSFNGPRSRYFGADGYTRDIYQLGILHSVAPEPVYGAAIYIDGQGNEWLVAISNNGAEDIVYVRTNLPDPSGAMFDAQTAPNGWKQVAQFPMVDGSLARSPWFFNGDASEAQTIRFVTVDGDIVGSSHPVTILDRYKIDLTGITGASIENLGNTRGSSTVIAVDYKNNEQLLLSLTFDRWLVINDQQLLSNEEIGAECFDGYYSDGSYCGGPNFSVVTLFSDDYGGLVADTFNLDSGRVVVHVYLMDLRTDTVAYSRVNSAGFSSTASISGRYHFKHNGTTINAGIIPPISGSRPLSVYHQPGVVPLETLGYYERNRVATSQFLSRFYPPRIQDGAGGWAVGPFGEALISERYFNGSVFSHFTGGSLENIANTVLINSTVLPVGLQ